MLRLIRVTVLSLVIRVALIRRVNLILQLAGNGNCLSRSCWVVHLLVSGRVMLESLG